MAIIKLFDNTEYQTTKEKALKLLPAWRKYKQGNSLNAPVNIQGVETSLSNIKLIDPSGGDLTKKEYTSNEIKELDKLITEKYLEDGETSFGKFKGIFTKAMYEKFMCDQGVARIDKFYGYQLLCESFDGKLDCRKWQELENKVNAWKNMRSKKEYAQEKEEEYYEKNV